MTTITLDNITLSLGTIEAYIVGISTIDQAEARRALAVLTTAARFAVEASQRLDTLQAELADCRAMTQRVATEAGQLTAAELRSLASAASAATVILDDNDNTLWLTRLAERVVRIAEDMDRTAPPCEHKTGIELWSDGRTTVSRCEWDCQRLLVSVITPEGYSRVVAEVATEASDD